MQLQHLLNLTLSYKILAFVLTLAISQLCEAAVFGNGTDKLALVDLKLHLTHYPADVFSSWNDSVDFCMWRGIKCSNKHHRVVGIYLKGMNLYGDVSPSIGNLSFLHELDLSNNFFNGVIPPELGRLNRLKYLNLSNNILAGVIPANLSHCTALITISLDHNSLKQHIPWELGTLLKLEELHLNNNNLTGNFPASLGNLSSLQEMDLSYNVMDGEIPDTVGGLKNLAFLILRVNQFSGIFPPAFYNLSSLQLLAFTQNNFHGYLRSDFGFLFPNIQRLWIGSNNFTGQIPVSFSNLSSLLQLNLGGNHFIGNVPSSFGNMQNIISLNLYGNLFGNYSDDDLLFLDSLANCSNLELLDVSSNQLGGELKASSVANLSSQLNWFSIYDNRISGSVPEEIAGLVGLTTLNMGSNRLTGNIPASIGTFPRLQSLYLYENRLTGEIPSSLGNISQLLLLYLFDNTLQGSLPESFSNLKLLQDARFCHNKLNGSIPPQLVSLSSLTITLNLSHNSFTGPLPAEVGNLTSLTALDVSYNHLSGDIPSNLGFCLSLITLNMQNNFLRGSVPDLSGLKGLEYLDLSKNNLTAQIPHYFINFSSLLNLNLSYNNFQGQVPVEGVFKNETAIQVYSNDNLCGGIPQLNLKPCPANKRRSLNLKLILPPVLVSSCLVLFLCMLFLSRKNSSRVEDRSESSFGRIYRKISFNELYNATRGFCSSHLIGAGSFGSVYVGILEQGELPVAVKVLNLQQQGASRSFVAECKAVGNIRHKNLVRILTVCSAVDYNGNDFKAVVYPYMSKGSLEKWLHPEDEMNCGKSFSLLQRMDIAIDIASALRYLHHQCEFPIVHCDLKPSNVLLDDDMTARVSDFGMARLLSRFKGVSNLNQFSSLGIKGTFGYIAPEYGLGSPVSTLGDVYSYGILLLELFTGRRPVDEAFKDNFNLHNFVELALLDRVLEIIDQSAIFDLHFNDEVMMIECLVSVLQIGIACSAENPQDRMNMRQVVHKLVSVKEKFLGLVMEDEKVERNLYCDKISTCES
ncbi:Leucine-rich repeat protein kinase family protein [Perilla frutescens var. frutescens]|nr:Leucine-rich repeat protein kinase family protein [Perilla frutescens var. frutescens]